MTSRKVNHKTLAQTLALLMKQPSTAHDVSLHTGVHRVTAQEWMRSLYAEGAVHISGWVADTIGRDSTPVYSLGAGTDTPRKKTTSRERTAAYRARLRTLNATEGEVI